MRQRKGSKRTSLLARAYRKSGGYAASRETTPGCLQDSADYPKRVRRAGCTEGAHAGRLGPLLGARPRLIHEIEEIPRPAKQFGFLARVLGNGSVTEEP